MVPHGAPLNSEPKSEMVRGSPSTTGGNPRGSKKYLHKFLALLFKRLTHILSLENGFVLLVSCLCPPDVSKNFNEKAN
eukprot:scaffold10768_cov114-Skeletonema_marinoi.AAC.3